MGVRVIFINGKVSGSAAEEMHRVLANLYTMPDRWMKKYELFSLHISLGSDTTLLFMKSSSMMALLFYYA